MTWWEGVDETRILVAPESENPDGKFLYLRNPKSGNKTCYLLINGSLQEIHWYKQPYGSWFVGDYVCQDGSLYVSTPVDPVFVLLPIFDEARMKKRTDDLGKFRQLDEIVFVNGYPGYHSLLSMAEKSMEVICDCKEIGSTKFFRLNDSKVLAWLNCKVNHLEKTLPKLGKNYATRDHKEILADAVSLLGEYVKDEPWLNLLCRFLKIDTQEVAAISQGSGISSDVAVDDPLSFNPVAMEMSGGDKKSTKSGRQTKKAKVETNSKSIKDMFTRASAKRK